VKEAYHFIFDQDSLNFSKCGSSQRRRCSIRVSLNDDGRLAGRHCNLWLAAGCRTISARAPVSRAWSIGLMWDNR
jgi:hypothetical protein